MKRFLLSAALLITPCACAQAPPRHAGYAPLEGLVGNWTIAGREGIYLETCDGYDGQRHVICHMASTRKDGSPARGMSILSFVPEQGYVYTGIGHRGRYETYRGGTYSNGVLQYLDRSAGSHVRIRIGPLGDKGVMPVSVQSSQDGVEWEQADPFDYIRVK